MNIRPRFLTFAMTCFVCGLYTTGLAAPIHILNLVDLTSEADVIVEGRVISRVEGQAVTVQAGDGQAPATQYVALVQVSRVLKGAFNSSSVKIQFVVPELPIGLQGISVGEYGLFFLKKGEPYLRFADPFYPSLPAVPGAQVPEGPALDEVTAALGAVLASPPSGADFGRAVSALGRLRTPLASQVLHQAMEGSLGDAHLRIAAALVARNDIAGLATVEAALVSSAGLSQDMVLTLAGSLEGMKNPEAVSSLTRLLTLDSPAVHRAAAAALRQTASRKALKPLASLLGDNDPLVRYYAVSGMGEITSEDEWTPSAEEFRQHERRYLEYWQGWASANLR